MVDYYTIVELASKAGVSRSKIFKDIKKGKIVTTKKLVKKLFFGCKQSLRFIRVVSYQDAKKYLSQISK